MLEDAANLQYSRRISKVVDHVRSSPHHRVSLQEAASIAGVSSSYFSRFFVAETGITYRKFLENEMVARATRLLAEHNYSITEIAGLLGCGNVRTLQRLFKRRLQTTPFDFKRRLKARAHFLLSADGFLPDCDPVPPQFVDVRDRQKASA